MIRVAKLYLLPFWRPSHAVNEAAVYVGACGELTSVGRKVETEVIITNQCCFCLNTEYARLSITGAMVLNQVFFESRRFSEPNVTVYMFLMVEPRVACTGIWNSVATLGPRTWRVWRD